MNKKVLFLYFTQSGQLGEIVNKFSQPFQEAGFLCDVVRVFPENAFPFPWKMDQFFEVMPASVMEKPTTLSQMSFKYDKYDLIVFAYQPWFLSPSIPATSLFFNEELKKRIKDTPVVTLIGSRNMWISAQEKIKRQLKNVGGLLKGNIVLVDKHSNLTSLVTIIYWMKTGKKDKYLGVFPNPGVAPSDIESTKLYGETVVEAVENNTLNKLQEQLIEQKAVEVKPNLMFIETRGAMLFKIWANFIEKKKNKTFWLRIFKYYLFIAIFLVAPIVIIINTLIFKPFIINKIKHKKNYFLQTELA
ncbi:MAG: hypothetical protein COW67_10710 [Flavobacteriales bacterium CG18_big_fil_WC_8_21_14_2_50_32_9]|nr:MAG: hypothetical protein COW67_10710 [Flavobacteriales bacterium CG18_big_fil_WC_8_21_14_2_50_32_9]PJC61444.1 MAG: hypothetical protein CO022_09790 [Flavobacteriales bacterium CG_4_9_14_0_2_um_filter_32_27]